MDSGIEYEEYQSSSIFHISRPFVPTLTGLKHRSSLSICWPKKDSVQSAIPQQSQKTHCLTPQYKRAIWRFILCTRLFNIFLRIVIKQFYGFKKDTFLWVEMLLIIFQNAIHLFRSSSDLWILSIYSVIQTLL